MISERLPTLAPMTKTGSLLSVSRPATKGMETNDPAYQRTRACSVCRGSWETFDSTPSKEAVLNNTLILAIALSPQRYPCVRVLKTRMSFAHAREQNEIANPMHGIV